MRYLLLLVVLLALSFSFVAAQDAAQDAVIEFSDHPARVVTNIDALRVRSSPAIEADNIVGRLQPGQQVHVLTRDGAWQQVRSENGLFGWSHSDYLIDLSPRQIGETRLFRIEDELTDTFVSVNADLRHIGQHSYIYVAEHPRQGKQANLGELRAFAKAFDEYIYPETYALWAPDPKPSHEGDERIVILFDVGYKRASILAGYYNRRVAMPGELHPYSNRTGFLEMTWHNDIGPRLLHSVTAHELQHLIQHHFDGDETSWVNEGLSVLTSAYLDYSEFERIVILPYQDQPYSQLNVSPELSCGYGPGFIFTTYILEQLGLEALRDFVRRPENSLAALDAVLAEHDSGLDTETFFADFVLANYLRDTQLGDGRFGYQLLRSPDLPKPYVRGQIIEIPTLIQESLPPYATDFYDFALPASDQPQQLELTLQFPNSAAQDGWLQLLQVVDGEVILQRYRASEYRNQMIHAELHPDAEHAFLAISPFRANARYLSAKQPYTLKIHLAGSEVVAADYATTESTLSLKPADPTKATEQRSPAYLAWLIRGTVDLLIENEHKIYAEGKTGEYIARVEELIAAGAAINNSTGGSLLAKVVKYLRPNTELLAVLLEGGANPNQGVSYTFSPGGAPGLYSGTPLNYAVFFEAAAHVKLLLDAGATVNNSVLRLASIEGNTRIIQLLLAAKADSRINTKGIRAAADLARRFGHHAAAEVLEAAAAAKLN